MGQYGPDLNLPTAPTQYVNPLLTSDISNQSALAKQLTSGNFTGDLSWLSNLTNPNSGYLTNAITAANNQLQPQFRDTLQQIKNQAAGAGSLESSTFTDALARSQSDLNSQYQSMIGNAAMQDTTNANNNRMSLFGSGLQMGQQAIGNETNQQNSTNAFNMENYSNLVAQAIQNNQNQQRYPDLKSLLSKMSGSGNGSNGSTIQAPSTSGGIFDSIESSSLPLVSSNPYINGLPNYNMSADSGGLNSSSSNRTPFYSSPSDSSNDFSGYDYGPLSAFLN